MRTFKLLTLALLSIVFIVLSSCSSDNPTNNNPQGDFAFLNIGNWWIYERYVIDSAGNKSGDSYFDSTFVTETEVVLGRTGAFKVKTENEGIEDIEDYYYTEGEKCFIHSDFINHTLKIMLKEMYDKLPISLEDMWVKLADYNNDSWLVKVDSIPPTEIVTGVTINGTFTISAEKGITKSMTVSSKSFTAQEFKLIFKFEGYMSLAPTNKLTFAITVHSWFDKKVGILLQTYDESKFAVPLFGTYMFEGFEKKLLRYNVVVIINE